MHGMVNKANHLHTRGRLMFPQLVPPHIEGHDVTESSMGGRYFSHRPGLAPFAVGLIEGLGEMFGTPARVEQVGWKGREVDHDTLAVWWPATAPDGARAVARPV